MKDYDPYSEDNPHFQKINRYTNGEAYNHDALHTVIDEQHEQAISRGHKPLSAVCLMMHEDENGNIQVSAAFEKLHTRPEIFVMLIAQLRALAAKLDIDLTSVESHIPDRSN